MNNQKTVSIYTLSCPKTGNVRYVGASSNPTHRLSGHKSDAKRRNSAPVQKWISSLLDEGLIPIMDIVDSADSNTRDEREKYWIQRYKDGGCDLLNQTDGGWYCKVSEETRSKRSGENNCWYGKSKSEETRRKNSESQPHKRAIIQYTMDKTFIRQWDSARKAEYELGVSHTHIASCCKYKAKSAGGYIWRYADDPIPQTEQNSLFQIEKEG